MQEKDLKAQYKMWLNIIVELDRVSMTPVLAGSLDCPTHSTCSKIYQTTAQAA